LVYASEINVNLAVCDLLPGIFVLFLKINNLLLSKGKEVLIQVLYKVDIDGEPREFSSETCL